MKKKSESVSGLFSSQFSLVYSQSIFCFIIPCLKEIEEFRLLTNGSAELKKKNFYL